MALINVLRHWPNIPVPQLPSSSSSSGRGGSGGSKTLKGRCSLLWYKWRLEEVALRVSEEQTFLGHLTFQGGVIGALDMHAIK